MKFTNLFLSFISLFNVRGEEICEQIVPNNNCLSFSVGPGTGCAWMCEYCENNLGTTNYYFTDGVCTYQSGGCVGNPQVGVTYTCCSS